MEEVKKQLQKAEKHPEKFLTEQEDWHSTWRQLTAALYSVYVRGSGKKPKLPSLAVDGSFDDEQIWQQLDLVFAGNDELLGNVASVVARAKTFEKDEDIDDEGLEEEAEEEDEDGMMSGDEEEAMMSEGEENDEDDDDEDEEEEQPKKEKKRVKFTSEVDDKFFKLAEAEEFADFEEKAGKEGDIDYFQDLPSDDEDETAENAKYSDFFDPPEDGPGDVNQGKNREDEEEGESEEEEDEEEREDPTIKSSLEMREDKLKDRIRMLEEQNIGDKPWQLKGESRAADRPQNALLEEFLAYDVIAKQAPVVTEEVSKTLEEVIKRRIKDKAWDDVERKQKPTRDPFEFKKQLVLEQEKSKLSLAEIYEKEYVKKRDGEADGEEGEEKPEHNEIRTKMSELFRKLDALSNFHFAPKLVEPEMKIVSNQPAITVEEVAPSAVSDAALLAPKEILREQRGELKSKDERTDTDKKRERRHKKKFQKQKFQRDQEKKNPKQQKIKLGGAVKTSMLDTKGVESFKSSRKFFEQLSEVGQKRPLPGKRAKESGKANVNVKRLKL